MSQSIPVLVPRVLSRRKREDPGNEIDFFLIPLSLLLLEGVLLKVSHFSPAVKNQLLI